MLILLLKECKKWMPHRDLSIVLFRDQSETDWHSL
jgi:hypothetical protein